MSVLIECPQMNTFEQVSSDCHQMSLAGDGLWLRDPISDVCGGWGPMSNIQGVRLGGPVSDAWEGWGIGAMGPCTVKSITSRVMVI